MTLKIVRKHGEKIWIFSEEGELLGCITTACQHAKLIFNGPRLIFKREEILNDAELQIVNIWEIENHG